MELFCLIFYIFEPWEAREYLGHSSPSSHLSCQITTGIFIVLFDGSLKTLFLSSLNSKGFAMYIVWVQINEKLISLITPNSRWLAVK